MVHIAVDMVEPLRVTGNIALLYSSIAQFALLRNNFANFIQKDGLILPFVWYLLYISLFIAHNAINTPEQFGWVIFGGVTTILVGIYGFLHYRYEAEETADTNDKPTVDV